MHNDSGQAIQRRSRRVSGMGKENQGFFFMLAMSAASITSEEKSSG